MVSEVVIGFTPGEACTMWYAIEEMQKKYQHDLDTRYQGDPRFGDEDIIFLKDEIQKCLQIRSKMIAHGFKP